MSDYYKIADPRQAEYRRKHLSGQWREVSFDIGGKPRNPSAETADEPADEPLPEPPTTEAYFDTRKRAPLTGVQRKARQRERERLRAEVAQLTPDQALIAQVVDRPTYLLALARIAEREQRRHDDIVEFRIRLIADNASCWARTGIETTRIVAQCFESDQRRGNAARPRTRRPERLRDHTGDVLRMVNGDDVSSPRQETAPARVDSIR